MPSRGHPTFRFRAVLLGLAFFFSPAFASLADVSEQMDVSAPIHDWTVHIGNGVYGVNSWVAGYWNLYWGSRIELGASITDQYAAVPLATVVLGIIACRFAFFFVMTVAPRCRPNKSPLWVVSRRAMRVVRKSAIFVCMVVTGCSHPIVTLHPIVTPHRENAVLLLDNHGGYSHAGRRIALRPDGSYKDTSYTDVVGDERSKAGHYVLNPERTHVVLSPEGGPSQELFSVDCGGQQYWVRDPYRERITQPSESWLRQISLRVPP